MFMRRRAFFLAPLMFVFLLIGLGSLFGRGRAYDAYQNGFADGQASIIVEAGDATVAPVAPAAESSPAANGHNYRSGYGGFFKLIFYFFLFSMFFRMLGFWRWRRWHGGYRGPGGRWGRHGCGPDSQDNHTREKQPEDLDPDIHYV